MKKLIILLAFLVFSVFGDDYFRIRNSGSVAADYVGFLVTGDNSDNFTWTWGGLGAGQETAEQGHPNSIDYTLPETGAGYSYTVFWVTAGTSNAVTGATYGPYEGWHNHVKNADNHIEVTIDAGSGHMTNVTYRFKNNDSVSHTYAVCKHNENGIDDILSTMTLAPGKTGFLQAEVSQGTESQLSLRQFNHNPDYPNGAGDWWSDTGATPIPSGEPQGVSASGENPVFDAGNPTNQSILWTSTNNTAAGSEAQAIRDAANTLYQSGVRIGQQAHEDALAIKAQIPVVSNLVSFGGMSNVWVQNFPSNSPFPLSTFTGISNLLAAANQPNFSNTVADLGTNLDRFLSGLGGILQSNANGLSNLFGEFGDVSNADIASETTMQGISNLLAGVYGGTNLLNLNTTNLNQQGTQVGISNLLASLLYGTNGPGTNGGGGISGIAGLIPGSATNEAAAATAAGNAEADYGVGTLLSLLNPVVKADAQGAGSPSAMSFQFCGQTINVDPVYRFPGVAATCYLGFKIVAELAFLFFAGKLFWECVRAKASAQTGGVPDLNFSLGGEVLGFGGSVGGNIMGVIIAVGIPAVFIGGFALVMAYVFSNLGETVAGAMNFTDFENGLGGIGFYLLTSFLPVNTIFTLACTQLTLQFTMSQLFNFASNVSRFLWGK